MSLSLQGIGAVLQSEDEFTKIVSLIPGGPAEMDGRLKPADRILSIAQGYEPFEDVVGWRLDEVVQKIRGAEGISGEARVCKLVMTPLIEKLC